MHAEEYSTTYRVKLKACRQVAEGMMAFQFEKPTQFVFTPGRFIDMTLLTLPAIGPEGNIQEFSVASTLEQEVVIESTRIATQPSSAYVRTATTSWGIASKSSQMTTTMRESISFESTTTMGRLSSTGMCSK